MPFIYLFAFCFRCKVLIIHISVYVFIRSWLWVCVGLGIPSKSFRNCLKMSMRWVIYSKHHRWRVLWRTKWKIFASGSIFHHNFCASVSQFYLCEESERERLLHFYCSLETKGFSEWNFYRLTCRMNILCLWFIFTPRNWEIMQSFFKTRSIKFSNKTRPSIF